MRRRTKSNTPVGEALAQTGAAASRFATPEDEVAYFEMHSTVEDPAATDALPPAELTVRGQRRTRKLISLRLFPYQLERIKRVAARQGMPYQTLIQLWLAQRLAEEAPPAPAPPARQDVVPRSAASSPSPAVGRG